MDTATVFFLTAIPLEYQAVKAHLEAQLESHWNSDRTKLYEIGEYHTPQQVHCRVIVRQLSRMGNLQALEETKEVIATFKPNYAFFVGIAAKLKDVDLGDVVAATQVEGYEPGKIHENKWQSRAPVFTASKRLSEIARQLVRAEQWQDKIKPVSPPRKPKALVASIVSGEKVVDSNDFMNQLRQDHSNAAALEMEGLGFLQAISNESAVEGTVIRGISDAGKNKADTDKEDWQTTAASHAAAFAFALLDELLVKVADLPLPPNPYPGLNAFRPENAKNFFGRDFETQRLLDKVLATPLIAVVGASGSGKSSLVFAGLIPALAPEQWISVDFRIQETTPTSGTRTLALYVPDSAAATPALAPFSDTSQPLATTVKAFFEQYHYQKSLLIVIDQFEELYTVTADKTLQQHFLDWLLTAVDDLKGSTRVKCRVVLTVRVDFMKDGLAYPPFAAVLNTGNDMLGPIATVEHIKQVIEKPAYGSEVTLEDGLTERILHDLQQQQEVPLPLLQFALATLWEQQQNRKLTHAAYEKMGELKGALSNYAEKQFTAITQRVASEQMLQYILTQLVHPATNSKRVATVAQIGAANWPLVGELVNARLVVTRRDESNQMETVELVHEALITGWGRLGHWVDENREFRSWQDKLEEDIKRWESVKQDDGALLRGARLVEAEAKLNQFAQIIVENERAFIAASVALREREKAKRRRLVMGSVVTAVVFIAVLSGWLWREVVQGNKLAQSFQQVEEQRNRAEQQRQEATKNLQEAQKTQSLFLADLSRQQIEQEHPVEGMLLALEGLPKDVNNPDRPYVVQAERNLYNALYNLREKFILQHDDSVTHATFSSNGRKVITASLDKVARLWDVENGQLLTTLQGHTNGIIHATFSPDEQQVATASIDKTVKLWDTTSGKLLFTLQEHTDIVRNIAFSPDGKSIVTASDDGTARLWNTSSGQLLFTLQGHLGAVWYAEFSPSGQKVVTASEDGTARLWNSSNGQLFAILRGNTEDPTIVRVYHATFSPDGQKLITSSRGEKPAQLWDVVNGRLFATLQGHEQRVNYASFSPDGQRVVTASDDETVCVWNVSSGQLLTTLKGHTGWVTYAAFSPDGREIVSASADNTVRLWDLSNRKLLATLRGITGTALHHVALSPDGRQVITASSDGTARLWYTVNGPLFTTLQGHTGSVNHAAFSPNGQQVITSSSIDKTARLWDTVSGQLFATLQGHTDSVRYAAFSPDGHKVITVSNDTTARLWNADNGQLMSTLQGHTGAIGHASFSLDGRRVVTASSDKTARVWDTESGQLIVTLKGHENGINYAEFSPDGQQVVTADGFYGDSADNTARLWDAFSGQQLAILQGHLSFLKHAEFSADGKKVVTASNDGTARLWDTTNGQLLFILLGHTQPVSHATFSPDGQKVATASLDNTVRLWDTNNGKLLDILQGHTDQVGYVAFSPNGQRIISTSSGDDTARLWDVDSRQLLATLQGHTDSVWHAEFSPDGQKIVTASMDGTARIWTIFPSTQSLIDKARQLKPRDLTPEQRKQFFLE